MTNDSGTPVWLRLPIMLAAGLGLIAALLGGMNRLGLILLDVPGRVALNHGGLMVSGFLGVVIAMERAVALPVKGSLLVPAMGGAGTLTILFSPFQGFGLFLILLASVGVVGLFGYIFSVQPSLHNTVLLAGGVCWLVGNTYWWRHVPVHQFVGWWMAFLVFVIAAERLELNRLLKLTFLQKTVFLAGVLLVLGGLIVSPLYSTWGVRCF
ncbi:MAG: hypothetical protein ABEK50_00305, partial [bacterium]